MIRVLIVEDDPMVAELNRRYVSKEEGFVVTGVVANASEALQYLAANPVDLVLADIFMPGQDGLRMIADIRSAGYGVDIIMVTAARDRASLQTALRLGVVDYLVKPFDFDRLHLALKQYQVRSQTIIDREHFTQQEIDRRIFDKQANPDLPKGLDRQTLHNITEAIGCVKAPFSTDDLVKRLGLSRVTLRKYLDYLVSCGSLSMTLAYGAVGRPVCLYTPIEKDAG